MAAEQAGPDETIEKVLLVQTQAIDQYPPTSIRQTSLLSRDLRFTPSRIQRRFALKAADPLRGVTRHHIAPTSERSTPFLSAWSGRWNFGDGPSDWGV